MFCLLSPSYLKCHEKIIKATMSLREFAKYRSRSLDRKTRRESRLESSPSATSSSSSAEPRKRRKHKHKTADREDRHSKKHKKGVKHKRKKRNYSDSSGSCPSSEPEGFDKQKKKSKHRHGERKKKKKDKMNKKSKNIRKDELKTKMCKTNELQKEQQTKCNIDKEDDVDAVEGPSLQDMQPQPQKRSMVPMTREEYEKQQSKVRRVYDPETGRHRLIKGDGEVLEEIVSYGRHKMINKMATHGDGVSFQAHLQKERFYDE